MAYANCLIPNHQKDFPNGFSPITREGETDPSRGIDTGIDFGIQKFSEGDSLEETHPKETVWVLLNGAVEITFQGTTTLLERTSLFDDPPTALHLPGGEPVNILARSHGCEWAVVRAENSRTFEPALFTPDLLEPEYRGEGLVQGACLRNVRLIFDRNCRKDSSLVLGEVINYPGKWSSYPPHHHPQPEIYHYRFTREQGYGHAELGDEVYKVRNRDTIQIPGGLDHSQVSAPGYGMYYLWIVRHLDGNPYTGFEFTKEHQWTLNPDQQGWQPKHGPFAKHDPGQ